MSSLDDRKPRALWEMYGTTVVKASTRARVGVGVLIRDDCGRVLLEKRADSGLWGLPGGRIEAGESVQDAAVREVKEETGLNIRITRLIGVYSDPSEGRIVTFPDNGDEVHLIDVILEAVIDSGELICSAESESLEFFDPHAVPYNLLCPPAQAPVRDALAGRHGRIC